MSRTKRHNPNDHDSYQVQGTGVLRSSNWGTWSSWNLPEAITTPFGTATLCRSTGLYTTSALVAITRCGRRYHDLGCRHAVNATTMVTIDTAVSLGLTACNSCCGDYDPVMVVAAVVRTVDLPSQPAAWNHKLLAVASANELDVVN